MTKALTEAQVAALRQLRAQHTDEGFPPVLDDLLTELPLDWVGDHFLGHRAHLELGIVAGDYVTIRAHSGEWGGDMWFSDANLDDAIKLLQKARAWQAAR